MVLFNGANIRRTSINQTDEPIEIILTGEIDNTNYLSCRAITQNEISCYFDDISIYKR